MIVLAWGSDEIVKSHVHENLLSRMSTPQKLTPPPPPQQNKNDAIVHTDSVRMNGYLQNIETPIIN